MATVKVILNKDIAALGEEGDVKQVAKGYARNFLFPRKAAVPYTTETVAFFEARRDEIEKRKEQKRQDAGAVKERLEALELNLAMPAGAGGKLYGAVTTLTIAAELEKQGFQVERKKIEVPGNGIKSVGKYKIALKLYGNAQATLNITVSAMELKTTESADKEKRRHSKPNEVPAEEGASETQPDTPELPKEEDDSKTVANSSAAG
ncbi:MAG: 50S ribosomal protein L9 [Spirochaetaceae bacterium]|jgi:large subunit ribosomal protein L9|nr:50S ribosomal protein L9 [Spirochaetaceae bacterium]